MKNKTLKFGREMSNEIKFYMGKSLPESSSLPDTSSMDGNQIFKPKL